MPEVIGDRGSGDYGSSSGNLGSSLGFNFETDLFGSNRKGAGNDFVGYFYDLKQTLKKSPLKSKLSLLLDDWEDPLYRGSR